MIIFNNSDTLLLAFLSALLDKKKRKKKVWKHSSIWNKQKQKNDIMFKTK